jgi:hypothetical protein
MRGGADEVFVVETFKVMGFDGDDVVLMLKAAGNQEEWFLGDDEAEFFKELRVYDNIRNAGFIFEAEKDETFGGAGALAANDVARDADQLVVASGGEIGGAQNILEMRTN